MQVVIEDYIHKPATRNALLILNLFASWLGIAVGVFSVLKVAFGGGAL
jgi:succinate dehydrogenase hydrophobic anchor subunit